MAEHVRKKLHEKLSIIDQNRSEKTDFSATGDFHHSVDRFKNHRTIDNTVHSSSCSLSSIDFDGDSCALGTKTKASTSNKQEKNCSSAAIRPDQKSSAGSRLSSLTRRAGLSVTVFEKKFKVVAEKSIQSLSDIKATLVKGITPPDGEEDEFRRAVRVKEFSNRISRNYLYPLARQLSDLHGASGLESALLNQKLLGAYQLAQNGLQAYQSHLPASVGDCSFIQLKILTSNVVRLCEIHRNHLKRDEENYVIDFIDTLKLQAELTNQTIHEYQTKPTASSDSALKSEQTKLSLTRYGEGARKNACVRKNRPEKRFSMYSSTAAFRKDAPWKRAVENLAKTRFNVKSKYKTATYKHRPPPEKEAEPVAPLPKFVQHKSGNAGRPTRLTTPLNEDRIETMVEVEGSSHLEKEEWEKMEKREEEGKKEKKGNEHHSHQQSTTEEILIKLLQFTLKSHKKETTTTTTEEDEGSRLAELVALVKQEPNMEVVKRVLDGIEHGDKENVDNRQQLTLEVVNRSQSSLTSGGGNRKEPKITVSGEKNAKLICITDDNSLVDPLEDKLIEEEERKNDADCAKKQTAVKTNENSKKRIMERKKSVRKKQTVKISRLKKSGKCLKHLERSRAVEIIQYKLDFYRHCKTNPLYRRSTTCQPCEMMNRISEELLNECLLAVAGEIEVNDVVEKVYHSELLL